MKKLSKIFATPKHGIYRYISVVNHIIVEDGEKITAYTRGGSR